MTKISLEAAHELHYELADQAKQFQPLIDDTVARIGDVARLGYNALVGPRVSTQPPTLSIDKQYPHGRINATYLTQYATEPLRQNILIPDSTTYTVSGMHAEERQRRVSLFGKSFGISSPGHTLRLTAERLPSEDTMRRPDSADFAITASGTATFQRRRTYTAPIKSIGSPKDYAAHRYPDVLHFMSPHEMRDGCAKAFTGALAVATVVAQSLELYKVAAETDPLFELIDAWQKERATTSGAIDYNLAIALPFKLAARAGASFNS